MIEITTTFGLAWVVVAFAVGILVGHFIWWGRGGDETGGD